MNVGHGANWGCDPQSGWRTIGVADYYQVDKLSVWYKNVNFGAQKRHTISRSQLGGVFSSWVIIGVRDASSTGSLLLGVGFRVKG